MPQQQRLRATALPAKAKSERAARRPLVRNHGGVLRDVILAAPSRAERRIRLINTGRLKDREGFEFAQARGATQVRRPSGSLHVTLGVRVTKWRKASPKRGASLGREQARRARRSSSKRSCPCTSRSTTSRRGSSSSASGSQYATPRRGKDNARTRAWR